jgi:hypothetical protein
MPVHADPTRIDRNACTAVDGVRIAPRAAIDQAQRARRAVDFGRHLVEITRFYG